MSSKKRKRDEPQISKPPKKAKVLQEDLTVPQPSEIDLSFRRADWAPQRKTRGQVWPKLKKIYQIEQYDALPPSVATHQSISAPPSAIPAKKYCDITGFEARYRDPSSGLRYANAGVFQWIVQNLDDFNQQQDVLDMRGAGSRPK